MQHLPDFPAGPLPRALSRRTMEPGDDPAWQPGALGWDSAMVRKARGTEHARRRAHVALASPALSNAARSPRTSCRVVLGTDAPHAQLGASLAWMVDGLDAQTFRPAGSPTAVRPGGYPDAAAPKPRASAPRRRGAATTCQARWAPACSCARLVFRSSRTRFAVDLFTGTACTHAACGMRWLNELVATRAARDAICASFAPAAWLGACARRMQSLCHARF